MKIPDNLGISFLPYSLLDMQKVQENRRMQENAASAFQWNDKYLPFVIVGVGVLVVPLLMKTLKRKGKK